MTDSFTVSQAVVRSSSLASTGETVQRAGSPVERTVCARSGGIASPVPAGRVV